MFPESGHLSYTAKTLTEKVTINSGNIVTVTSESTSRSVAGHVSL